MTGLLLALRPWERVITGYLVFCLAAGLALGELLHRRYGRRDA